MVPDNACLTQLKAARDMVHIDYSIKTGVSRLDPASLSGGPARGPPHESAARVLEERHHVPVATALNVSTYMWQSVVACSIACALSSSDVSCRLRRSSQPTARRISS